MEESEQLMQGRQPGQAVCLEPMKRYSHGSKWQNIKDKVPKMTIRDVQNCIGKITKEKYGL